MFAWVSLAFVVVMFSSTFIAIKLALVSFDANAIAYLRLLSASIAMLLIYLRLPQKNLPKKPKEWGLLVVSGLCGFGIYNLLLNYAVGHLTPAICSFVIGLVPVASVVLAAWWYAEKVGMRSLKYIAICVVGVSVILIAQLSNVETLHASLLGVLCIFLAMLLMAVYNNVQRPLLQSGYSGIEITAWSIWFAFIFLMPLTPHFLLQVSSASWHDIVVVIYLGVFPTAIAYAMWSHAMKILPFAKVVSASYFIPFVVILLQVMVLSIYPSMWVIVGGLISTLGAFLVAKQRV